MNDTYFALCPAGYAPWSLRLYDAVLHSAVPVILANDIIEPFERFLDWRTFTVKVDADLITTNSNISFLITMTNHSDELRRNLLHRNRNHNTSRLVNTYLGKKLLNVHLAAQWLHWDEKSPKSIYKLLLLELWCRSRHGIGEELCHKRSASIIGGLSYW